MSFPIAVQVYSVRDDAKQDMRGVLTELKAMGYDGVEFAGLYGHTPEEVRDMCREIGLVPISAHVEYEEMMQDSVGTMKAYKTIGCTYIVVPYLAEGKRGGDPVWPEIKENIKMLGAVAKSEGLTLLYHNHDFEFIKYNGKYMLEDLYESVDADLLQTQLDTCWVKVGGEDPAEYLKKYAGRAPVVHLKDFTGSRKAATYELIGLEGNQRKAVETEKFSLRPVGYGCQDFPAIIEAAKVAGTEWLIVEQDRPDEGRTRMECVKLSREYLKSIGY